MKQACLAIWLLSLTFIPFAWGDEATPAAAEKGAAVEFFEREIRPLLLQRCADCHGSDTQEAGLRLDSGPALLKGGDSGPVVVPGQPDRSRLLEVISYDRDIQMPPDEKLPIGQIEALRKWIHLGAPWPSSGETSTAESDSAKSRESNRFELARATHWAFQPIANPPLPPVVDDAWAQDDLDRFVLARLERESLTASPPASRATLLRRATFDLIGIPPTVEEISAFEHDPAPDAFAKVVERLLASPEYGQRWGRHWLDVARYADTKGYVFTEDTRYPYSYTYRDYVIRAFNDDVPFDRFVLEQIAADQLELGVDQRALAGLGFLTVGSRFMNNIHDIIDDRIDVVTRGLMGLTVTCARCHDHKFDAITQSDYYALYGVFASSTEPGELPLVAVPEVNEAYRKHQANLAQRQAALDTFIDTQLDEVRRTARSRSAEYLVAAVTTDRAPIPDGAMLSLQPDELKPMIIARWRAFIGETGKSHHPVMAPWHALAALAPEAFAGAAPSLVANLPVEQSPDQPAPVNRLVKEALLKAPLTSMTDVARAYGELFAQIEATWQEALRVAASNSGEAPHQLDDPAAEELRQVLYGENTPPAITPTDVEKQYDFVLDRTMANEYGCLRRELDDAKASSPDEPPRAMALIDSPTPHESRIFLRGNPARHGDVVPRRFLQLLSTGDPEPFTRGSGRLELAQAIVAPANPLTARVIVNRVWMHHFGAPLVSTPSDFGVQSDPPSHPELLDHLASWFREHGWSLKKLHRKLMLSSTYQQASDLRVECAQTDPENRLYWRMNRRRLEFEAARDSLLAVAGRLDRSLDGRPVNLLSEPFSTRRTVYGFADRGDLPGLFRSFDFASPDVSSPQRPRTTVPQQALFLLNSPFVIEQARNVAARPEVTSRHEPAARVRALYQIVLGRDARPDEVRWALDLVNAPGDTPRGEHPFTRWEQLAQVLLQTNEFMFVD
jgi:cytochrome c553